MVAHMSMPHHATCVHSPERVNLLTQPRALLTIVNALCLTSTEQLAHSPEGSDTFSDLNVPTPKKLSKNTHQPP